jgi:phenylalanyl-tRNA synthetase beta chain
MVDWASRRAAGLILELAGGLLEQGSVTAGTLATNPAVIPLDPEQVGEVLGVVVPAERQREILVALGFEPDANGRHWRAPSWRRDCTREIDLVEEIARIAGYDLVPEDVAIAVRPVELSPRETAVRAAGSVLVGQGFCEAVTRSVVAEALAAWDGGWSAAAALEIAPPLVRGADRLRRSLLPSLLEARADNVAVGNADADLFEIARGYLPRTAAAGPSASPAEEPLFVSFVCGGDFFRGKGLAEAVLAGLGVTAAEFACRTIEVPLLACGRAAELVLTGPDGADQRVGILGEIAPAALERFAVPGPVAAAEIRLDLLEAAVARERPITRPAEFPAVERDVNLVVAESVLWADLERAIRGAAGTLLAGCRVVEIWRDAERLGAGRKSVVVALRLQSAAGTLTGEEAGQVVAAVVEACGRDCAASLRT